MRSAAKIRAGPSARAQVVQVSASPAVTPDLPPTVAARPLVSSGFVARSAPLHTSLCKVLQRLIESTQYLSIRYTERLAEAGIERSVGSVGDSYDNALAETINGLYKTEVIHRRGPWRNADQVEYATLEWVDWFNNRRLLEPLGYVPPVEFEQAFFSSQSTPAMAVGLN